MNPFIQKHSATVTGILSGFDRLVFRGYLKSLAYPAGMKSYLYSAGVLLKDFAQFVQFSTRQIVTAATEVAEQHARPVLYLPFSRVSKEDLAKQILTSNPVDQGLVCVLKSVEPCMSYDVRGNRESKQLELVYRPRKCLHIYQYWIDPVFGFINARIQTWFPFSIQICLNGREWLSRQMETESLRYQRRDNCFTWLEDASRAQTLMNRQREIHWPTELDRIAQNLNPAHSNLFANFPAFYYWSVFQSEWATDVMFCDQASLDAIYPSLIHHGLQTFKSPNILRFLGHKLTSRGTPWEMSMTAMRGSVLNIAWGVIP